MKYGDKIKLKDSEAIFIGRDAEHPGHSQTILVFVGESAPVPGRQNEIVLGKGRYVHVLESEIVKEGA